MAASRPATDESARCSSRPLARSLLAAQELKATGEDVAFMDAKIVTARFYAEHILPRCAAGAGERH